MRRARLPGLARCCLMVPGTSETAGSEFRRERSLERMAAEPFDLLVVGGGVTGAGVALDGAARGLSVARVEGQDGGSGTSSKSSKLVHGGLRYLQQRDYLLVREGLVERHRLLTNAPHLVRPLAFLIPLFGRDGVMNRAVAKAYSTALWSYDVVGGMKIGMRHRRIDRAESARLFPSLRTELLVAGFIYWDARTDDARLTLTLARTAADHGAVAANYAPVATLTRDGHGKVNGAVLGSSSVAGRDTSGLRIEARAVVNASGVWADEVRQLGDPGSPVSLRPAKGVHITVAAEKLPTEVAVVLPVLGDRRSIFVVPWGDRVYVGTTDTDYEGSLDDPQCTGSDIAYLIKAVNTFVSEPISEADVLATWAGLRPLVKEASTERTADLSRRHHVSTSAHGLVTITGGKLTTYRRMAADAVDAALIQLGRGGRRQGRSATKRLRLHGFADPEEISRQLMRGEPTAGSPLPSDLAGHLAGRHGADAPAVAGLAETRAELGRPLVPGLPYLAAEAIWAARNEMAITLEDVLARRTRSVILDREATARAAPDVAELLMAELGWDAAERDRQVNDVLGALDAARTAAGTPAGLPDATQPAPN